MPADDETNHHAATHDGDDPVHAWASTSMRTAMPHVAPAVLAAAAAAHSGDSEGAADDATVVAAAAVAAAATQMAAARRDSKAFAARVVESFAHRSHAAATARRLQRAAVAANADDDDAHADDRGSLMSRVAPSLWRNVSDDAAGRESAVGRETLSAGVFGRRKDTLTKDEAAAEAAEVGKEFSLLLWDLL